MMIDEQMEAALESQVAALVARIKLGGEDGHSAHDELVCLAEKAGPGFSSMFENLLDGAAEAERERQSVEARAECEQQQDTASCQPKKRDLMSRSRVAEVLEDSFRNPEAATAIRGAEEAIESKDVEDLLYVLEALDGVSAYGRLAEVLRVVAEETVSALLGVMLERFAEAQGLFSEQRAARGLRADGLRNRAIAALKDAKSIRFNKVGLVAIERLIRSDRLPEAVREVVSDEELDEMKREKNPATILLNYLIPKPPEQREARVQHRPMREGKTSFDKAKKQPSKADRAAADAAYRAKMKGSNERNPLVGKGKHTPRSANDPNKKKR